MTLTFAQPVDPAAFAALPGTADVRGEGRVVSLVVRSGLDAVIKLASQWVVTDMEFERPTLEEVFLTYYGNSHGETPGRPEDGAAPERDAGAEPAATPAGKGGREP
jgi:ABC-2 type transport system ATP-binding protein